MHATVNGHPFETVVEPDGRRGHWVRLDRSLQQPAGIGPGDTAELTLEVAPDWPEPEVPEDLAAALAAAPARIRDVWHDITPLARWEWVRWVQATSNHATRQRPVEGSISKMDRGKRRACCFDSPRVPTRTWPGAASCASRPRRLVRQRKLTRPRAT